VEFDPRPTPGGVKRFLIAVVIALGLLAGVVVGVFYWMRSTSHGAYSGPAELAYPEKRPFR
jgi:flagellar basal body-associated protein FliL